jgi:hypothetical protein
MKRVVLIASLILGLSAPTPTRAQGNAASLHAAADRITDSSKHFVVSVTKRTGARDVNQVLADLWPAWWTNAWHLHVNRDANAVDQTLAAIDLDGFRALRSQLGSYRIEGKAMRGPASNFGIFDAVYIMPDAVVRISWRVGAPKQETLTADDSDFYKDFVANR